MDEWTIFKTPLKLPPLLQKLKAHLQNLANSKSKLTSENKIVDIVSISNYIIIKKGWLNDVYFLKTNIFIKYF